MQTRQATLLLLAAALLCFSLGQASADTTPHLLGFFNTTSPGFLSLIPIPDSQLSLYISSFTGNPFSSGSISLVKDVGSQISNPSSIQSVGLPGSWNWPNLISQIPDNAIPGVSQAIAYGDGFLVPGKSNGGIYALVLNGSDPIKLSSDSGYFYHMATWFDVDGDGLLDVVTARGKKPLFGSGSGQLVWLKQPSGGLNDAPWNEQTLVNGPDFLFTTAELDNDPKTLEVFATEFFGQEVSLTVIDSRTGGVAFHRIIDNTIGPGFGVSVVTLNGDGAKQLLATNHQGSQDKTGMFAFEIPADYRNGNYVKHQLADNFPIVLPGIGQASPGMAYAVYPNVNTNHTSEKPYILLAGDGAGAAYWFTPTSQPFSYEQMTLIDVDATVGGCAVADVNGDGWVELFVTAYDHNAVFIFTLAPSEEETATL